MNSAALATELITLGFAFYRELSAEERADFDRKLEELRAEADKPWSATEDRRAITAKHLERLRAVGALTAREPALPAVLLDGRSPGQRAFEAYNAKRGGLTHDGKPTPPWAELGDGVRDGWEAGAQAAREE